MNVAAAVLSWRRCINRVFVSASSSNPSSPVLSLANVGPSSFVAFQCLGFLAHCVCVIGTAPRHNTSQVAAQFAVSRVNLPSLADPRLHSQVLTKTSIRMEIIFIGESRVCIPNICCHPRKLGAAVLLLSQRIDAVMQCGHLFHVPLLLQRRIRSTPRQPLLVCSHLVKTARGRFVDALG